MFDRKLYGGRIDVVTCRSVNLARLCFLRVPRTAKQLKLLLRRNDHAN